MMVIASKGIKIKLIALICAVTLPIFGETETIELIFLLYLYADNKLKSKMQIK